MVIDRFISKNNEITPSPFHLHTQNMRGTKHDYYFVFIITFYSESS